NRAIGSRMSTASSIARLKAGVGAPAFAASIAPGTSPAVATTKIMNSSNRATIRIAAAASNGSSRAAPRRSASATDVPGRMARKVIATLPIAVGSNASRNSSSHRPPTPASPPVPGAGASASPSAPGSAISMNEIGKSSRPSRRTNPAASSQAELIDSFAIHPFPSRAAGLCARQMIGATHPRPALSPQPDVPVEWRRSEGLIDYLEALAEMEARAAAIRDDGAPELVWLLEHPPLYTAGTSADPSEISNPWGFPVYDAGRGGRYTYHGPGQRIGYLMIDLARRGRDLRRFVHALEDWVIGALAELGVAAHTAERRIGIWVNHRGTEAKLGAI